MKENDHIFSIRRLIETVWASKRIHAVIVEGPAGWGKTTAVDSAMKMAGIQPIHLGSYSTPLHFFNFLHENSGRFIVIDDTAGLFSDQSSMAILKAATWPQGSKRKIRWGSTTNKALAEEFLFEGKLAIVCNTFPSTPDGEAVKSRSFPYKISVTPSMALKLLERAASDKKWFEDSGTARLVSKFITSRLTAESLPQISFRTLQMGYELAQHNTDDWQGLLEGMIVSELEDPKRMIKRLAKEGLKVKDQVAQFEETTGMKRRTFFKYRREMNLTK